MKAMVLVALALGFAYTIVAHADDVPECVDQSGQAMSAPNNDQVLGWKQSTQNLYLNRGYIKGTLVGVIPHGPDHLHLDVSLSPRGQADKANDIEVIYNLDFGSATPDAPVGAEVIACGDYITSIAAAQYPASPLGAILHWIHRSNSPRHASGFLMIGGTLYGQGDAGPRKPHNWREYEADEVLVPPCRPDQGNCGIH